MNISIQRPVISWIDGSKVNDKHEELDRKDTSAKDLLSSVSNLSNKSYDTSIKLDEEDAKSKELFLRIKKYLL